MKKKLKMNKQPAQLVTMIQQLLVEMNSKLMQLQLMRNQLPAMKLLERRLPKVAREILRSKAPMNH